MPASKYDRPYNLKIYPYISGKCFLLILFFCIPAFLNGQSLNHRHLTRNEIAVIPGLVYDLGESKSSYVIHGHYLRSNKARGSKISTGVNFEYVAGDETHITTGPLVAIHPAGPLVILYSPGLTYKRSDENPDYYFSNHFEIAMEFDLGDRIHLGPSAGLSMSGYDIHFSVGIHTGFAF